MMNTLQDAALVKTAFATSNMQMFMACWDRENILVFFHLLLSQNFFMREIKIEKSRQKLLRKLS